MTRYLPVANPQNRFSSTTMEYDDPDVNPGAPLEVYEDHSRSILASNDSPDVGFKWSVNPYRGCFHACSYCLSGDTQILMGDSATKELRNVRVGDQIYGTVFDGKYRRYQRTQVLAHWQTVKAAYRVVLRDGTKLIASGDHRFLTRRGWKYVADAPVGQQRPHLTTNDKMMGVGAFAAGPVRNAEYKRGYLCGMIRGDASLFRKQYARPNGALWTTNDFRLALVDLEALRRSREYLREADVVTSDEFVFQEATATRQRVVGIRTQRRDNFEQIEALIRWPDDPSADWSKGFLAGIFDAEGTLTCSEALRIANTDPVILAMTTRCLRAFGFDTVLEPPRGERRASDIRVRGGLPEHLRFFHTVDPAIRRKCELEGVALKGKSKLEVACIEKLGFDMLMFDITTGTGDFIANGVVSHNCYARPSHEYLSLGAGSDFERKIIVKRNAAELLREAFDKKSWKGEQVVFSGITDCYQPLEARMKITRGCLEVCVEYQNPAGFITKSPIIERDIDLLVELTRVASCRVSVSIPFWDPDVAKAIEPFVTTPARRMKIVETLAKAGVRVGVSVSPIVPGLNDEDIGDVLKAARDAGASHAFYVLLRLPGAVKEVFETSLRKNLPLRAEKVLRRLREAYGGKLYDSRFGVRGSGSGVYADTIAALFDRMARRNGLRSDEMEQWEHPDTFKRPERAAKNGQTSFGF